MLHPPFDPQISQLTMEDILKVLTRGNKPLRRKLLSSRGALTAKPNPQLYDTAPAQSQPQTLSPEQDSDLSDVDFFAPKSPEPQKHTEAKEAVPKSAEQYQPSLKRISEPECRQIFRSHRLELTLKPMDAEAENEDEEPPRKKRKKKNEMKPEPLKPIKKKPIYPQPLSTFSELRSLYNVSRRLLKNLHKQAYKVPTEIQLGSLPLLLDPSAALSECSATDIVDKVNGGIDLISMAPTGSGKTMTFLVHAISQILQRRSREGIKDLELDAVIVAPTRELATQIAIEGRKLAAGTGVKIVRMKKGVQLPSVELQMPSNEEVESNDEDLGSETSEEEDEASGGEDKTTMNKKDSSTAPITKANVIVTTPLMLQGFLKGRKALPSVRQLVLDEADVLLDPLFLEQTAKIWDACTNTGLRVSFWSGTMSSTIEATILEKLSSRVKSLGSKPAPLFRIVVGQRDTAAPNISHKIIYAGNEHGKIIGLRQLFRPTPGDKDAVRITYPFLIFTQTIDRAKALYEEFRYDLPLADDGSSRIAVLHSALSETARSAIMTRFRSNEIWVIISTDLLMRGIDFPTLKSVVNYDLPQSGAAYVHRSGRAGRAGRDGIAVTFWTQEDRPYIKAVANVIRLSEKQAGIPIEKSGVAESLYRTLPEVKKGDRRELRAKGVPARRPQSHTSKITTKSGYDKRKENNRRGAIEASKRRKRERANDSGDESWGGIDD
ncbi:ATP-dependent RNA helicase ROK1 [Zalerion maritima]|uniref:RNA helicase n=1 Tax=Zalerion maritima TaxID=339359 RepID=A0AAD5RTI8_9PEZI|nr:ATP-dependent RNA helicase ROK1 [Zalerion maritima]